MRTCLLIAAVAVLVVAGPSVSAEPSFLDDPDSPSGEPVDASLASPCLPGTSSCNNNGCGPDAVERLVGPIYCV